MAQGRSTMSGYSENTKMNADDADEVGMLLFDPFLFNVKYCCYLSLTKKKKKKTCA